MRVGRGVDVELFPVGRIEPVVVHIAYSKTSHKGTKEGKAFACTKLYAGYNIRL